MAGPNLVILAVSPTDGIFDYDYMYLSGSLVCEASHQSCSLSSPAATPSILTASLRDIYYGEHS